jgi:hypothetical protein
MSRSLTSAELLDRRKNRTTARGSVRRKDSSRAIHGLMSDPRVLIPEMLFAQNTPTSITWLENRTWAVQECARSHNAALLLNCSFSCSARESGRIRGNRKNVDVVVSMAWSPILWLENCFPFCWVHRSFDNASSVWEPLPHTQKFPEARQCAISSWICGLHFDR